MSSINSFDILKICGLAIISIIVLTVVKQLKNEFVLATRLAVTAVFITIIITLCIPIYNYIAKLTESIAISQYVTLILKGTGIAIIVKVCSEICHDMGEDSVASYVESIGKLILLIMSIPLIEEILSVIKELIK